MPDKEAEKQSNPKAVDGAPQMNAEILDVVPEAHPRFFEEVVRIVWNGVAHRRYRRRKGIKVACERTIAARMSS
jgi:hypothetical protein